MAIAPLYKMTLYGAEAQKDSVIDGLQGLGCVHLVDLRRSTDVAEPVEVATDAHEALKFLQTCPEKRRAVHRLRDFDRNKVAAEVLKVKRDALALGDERDQLKKSIQELLPWGDFQLPADDSLADVRFWFYETPLRDVEQFVASKLPWREISRDHRNAYVLVAAAQRPQNLPGSLVELDERSLSQLRSRLEDVEEQLEDLHHQRVGLTRWRRLLADALDEADDVAAREQVSGKTLDHNEVFALQGWVPRQAAGQIRDFAKDYELALTLVPPAPDDEPPTLLQLPEPLAGSEALVTFYKTPRFGSWDPSLVAYLSFAIFFAMIIADAGYGAVLALLTAYYWRTLGKTQSGRRGRNVVATVVASTLVYGVLCGSYFGVSPAPDSFLGRLQVVDAQSQAMMMPLTILVGVIHLSIANLVAAWIHRRQTTALAALGWVVVMFGATLAGYGAFRESTPPAPNHLVSLGTGLLIIGLASVFLFSSARPLLSLSFTNHTLRALEGLQGLTGVSGLFGDVLSYLRLFALGLSSAKLSATFNSLGRSAWDEAGFGVVAAIGIVIFGHTLNLLLSIMSGVVHGLRLNCIEFFKWSLPEEGHLFQRFAKKARQL